MCFRSLEELITAYTADVSRGGLYVASARQLATGTWVKLSLELPDGLPPAEVDARVVYALEPAEAVRVGREPGMGVEFEDPGGLADRIAALLGASAPADPLDHAVPVTVLLAHAGAGRAPLVAALEAGGHRVIKARDGLEAIGRALERAPDVVVAAPALRILDGFQLLRALRTREPTRDIPVVMLLSDDVEAQRARAYELGADDVIEPGADVAAVIVRAVTRARRATPAPDASMSGALEQVSAISLLAFAEAERRSGLLVLTSGPRQAVIGLIDGAVVSVDLDTPDPPASMLERLLCPLDWLEGRFALRPDEATPTGEDLSIQAALLEHARRLDERERP